MGFAERLRTRTFLSSRHSPENAEAKQMRSRLTDGVFTLPQLVSLPCRAHVCEYLCVCVSVCVCEREREQTKMYKTPIRCWWMWSCECVSSSVKKCESFSSCTCKMQKDDVAMGSNFTISQLAVTTLCAWQLIPFHPFTMSDPELLSSGGSPE